jgi:hypothetical protein
VGGYIGKVQQRQYSAPESEGTRVVSSITKKSSAIVVPVVPITTTKPTTVAGSSAEIIDFAAVKATKRPKARRRVVKLSNDERMRRLRLGDLHRLLRDRCHSPVLPDDDAGRQYLKELLLPISLGPNEARNRCGVVGIWGPVDRMRHEIELSAPWMSDDDARDLRLEIMAMPRWQRKPTAKTLGSEERLRVTYAERERLRLWTIGPCDMTENAMALIRKRKKRQRDRQRRRSQGAKPRAEYLAASISQTKPWIAAGFNTRRSWERNGKPDVASPRQVNLSNKTELALATKEELSTDAGRCVRPSTATHAGQTGTCPNDGFLTADEAAWLVE